MDQINLQQIISDFPDCITNGAKLKAILIDTYPEISKAVVNTLVVMTNSGIAKEIQDTKDITELDISRWQQKLEDEGFSEKVICSCLNMVFIAFDLSGACISNGEKLVVGPSVSIQTKSVLPPSNLSDFEIKGGVLVKYKGNSADVTIPDGVKKIGDEAFYNCSGLKNVVIPNSVSSIGDYAFNYCDELTSVSIPNSVTSIGQSAFDGCSGLTSVTIPSSVISIGFNAFGSCCKLVEVINNSRLKIIKGDMIENGSVGWAALNVKKGDGTDIVNKDGYLFYTYDNVNYLIGYVGQETKLVLPKEYNGENYQIYTYAFYGCSRLNSITIPDSITTIIDYAFIDCRKLTGITIGSGVTSIGECAFSGCGELMNVVIPEGAKRIGTDAFMACTGLTSVTIPNSVADIGYAAFEQCGNLTHLSFNGTKEQWKKITKHSGWKYASAITSVKCIDGIVKIK